MIEFIPWFIQHYWLPAVVLFVLAEVLVWGTLIGLFIRHRRRA